MLHENTSLLVLCGGQGQRMGGRDKPLIQIAGQPMVDRVVNSTPATFPKLISANRNLEQYARRGQVITDAQTDIDHAHGPLIGIYSGLRQCTTKWLLVSPGDTPFLPHDWWRKMMQASKGHHNVVAFDGVRQQHLHLLLQVANVIDHLAAYLRAGRFEAYKWLQQLEPTQAQFDDPAAFANVNDPEELAQANQRQHPR